MCSENIKMCKDNKRTQLQNDRDRERGRLSFSYLQYFKSFKRSEAKTTKGQLFNLHGGYTSCLLHYFFSLCLNVSYIKIFIKN